MSRITVEVVDPHSLVDNPKNPRLHDRDQLLKLGAALRRFGQTKPILARKANRMIVAGHGLRQAMMREGFSQAQVYFWDVDQQTADAFMLADNRLGDLSQDDPAKVEQLLHELEDFEAEELGFTDAQVEELLNPKAKDFVVEEMATDEVEDRFWISVRGPLQLQASALDKLKILLADYPDIDVEMGTSVL